MYTIASSNVILILLFAVVAYMITGNFRRYLHYRRKLSKDELSGVGLLSLNQVRQLSELRKHKKVTILYTIVAVILVGTTIFINGGMN